MLCAPGVFFKNLSGGLVQGTVTAEASQQLPRDFMKAWILRAIFIYVEQMGHGSDMCGIFRQRLLKQTTAGVQIQLTDMLQRLFNQGRNLIYRFIGGQRVIFNFSKKNQTEYPERGT